MGSSPTKQTRSKRLSVSSMQPLTVTKDEQFGNLLNTVTVHGGEGGKGGKGAGQQKMEKIKIKGPKKLPTVDSKIKPKLFQAKVPEDIKSKGSGKIKPIDEVYEMHAGQVKAAEKLMKIDRRRKKKGKLGKTGKQLRLEKDIDMTAQEYQNKKRDDYLRFLAGVREYGPGGSGSMIEGHQKFDARKFKESTQAIQNEKDRVNMARTQQLIDAADEAYSNKHQIKDSTKKHVDPAGQANLDYSKYKTTAQQVQESGLFTDYSGYTPTFGPNKPFHPTLNPFSNYMKNPKK